MTSQSKNKRSVVLTEPNRVRLAALRKMKRLALALLLFSAVIFAVAFAFQDTVSWLGYVRAAAEGAMVGALADWFAVTALFRHPFGIPIPHTAIIPTRKNEIGESLGSFVRDEFLSETVIVEKLQSLGVSKRLGSWLVQPASADRIVAETSVAARSLLTLLGDRDIENLIERLAKKHLFEPEWAPIVGRLGARFVGEQQHHVAVDALIDKAEEWLIEHPNAFGSMVSERLPKWLPKIIDRFVDNTAHREILGFVSAVKSDRQHPLRQAIDKYLTDLTSSLQHDPKMIARVEKLKSDLLESPRVREFAGEAWRTVKDSLDSALENNDSELRRGLRRMIIDIGDRLLRDEKLAAKLDLWLIEAAGYLVRTYRHEIANIITETVEKWDPDETTEKIELQIGRDLQFIRINGTVVGALAGLLIFSIANGIHTLIQ